MNLAARKPVRDRVATARVAPKVPHAELRTGNAKAPKNEAAFTKMYPKPEAVALNRAGATSEQMVIPLESSHIRTQANRTIMSFQLFCSAKAPPISPKKASPNPHIDRPL